MTIISKSDEQKRYEARIMRDFGGNSNNVEHREHAEIIAARTAEAMKKLNRMEADRR